MERSMYKAKRDNMLASQYRKRQTNLQKMETIKKSSQDEIEELFDSLADGNEQLDVSDLISYMNSLGSQYRDSIMLKILRIYQVIDESF
jgi:Ca2+-binding EF-hand superfamily protein